MHCDQTCTVICCLHTHQQYAKRVMAWHVTIATSKRPFAKPLVPSVLCVMHILSAGCRKSLSCRPAGACNKLP
jgi:hypothetical protein